MCFNLVWKHFKIFSWDPVIDTVAVTCDILLISNYFIDLYRLFHGCCSSLSTNNPIIIVGNSTHILRLLDLQF